MNYFFNKFNIKIKTVSTFNYQSLQAEHLTNLGQMWPKYLSLGTFIYNTFNTPKLANYNPYELVFGRKPKILLNIETMPDIKVLCSFKKNYNLLNK